MRANTLNLNRWGPRLESMGFLCGGEPLAWNEFQVERGRLWWTFSQAAPEDAAMLTRRQEQPGLWKTVPSKQGVAFRREFDVPAEILSIAALEYESEGDEPGTLRDVLAWIENTARGKVPTGWRCPEREELLKAVPSQRLTFQSGTVASQASLDCSESRLTVRFPLQHGVPSTLSTARLAWLNVVLEDAHQRSRMVRIVVRDRSDSLDIDVEADLSGAPHVLLPELLRMSVDAARSVVGSFVWPVVVLADPAVHCTVWDVLPDRTWSVERR